MSIQLNINTIKDCIARYSSIGQLKDISPMSGKFHNIAYNVYTSKGHFVLKVLTTHYHESTEDRYEYILSVMEIIGNLGIKVPIPIRNNDSMILTLCGNFKAVLSEYIDGQPFQRQNLRHQDAAGNLLGMFHKATSNYEPRGTCWLGELDSYLILDESLTSSLPAIPEALVIREYFGELVKRSIQVNNELKACNYSQLPRVIIHSEYVVKHLKMTNNFVNGLLDFEYTYKDARSLDIALALEDFPCTKRERRDFDYDKIKAFITAYNSCGVPLHESEIISLPVLLKAWYLGCITFWIDYVIRTKNRITLFNMQERIEKNFEDIDWWNVHGDEFVSSVIEKI
jgi:Ser/Thr protein kinase RdoA (MazF antagonist)